MNKNFAGSLQTLEQDIETSAYALLYLAEKNDLSQGMKIVNWLVSQRNPEGGFSSTQVSLLIFTHQYFFAFESNTKFISTLNQVILSDAIFLCQSFLFCYPIL